MPRFQRGSVTKILSVLEEVPPPNLRDASSFQAEGLESVAGSQIRPQARHRDPFSGRGEELQVPFVVLSLTGMY